MTSQTAASPTYDLRSFFRRVGAPSGGAGLSGPPPERTDMTAHVEIVDDKRAPLTGDPLAVTAFIDGVQSCLTVTYRDHRPVYLAYQAAGAVGAGAQLVGLRERLTLMASVADADWVAQVNDIDPPLPVTYLAAAGPVEVEREAYASVGDWRDRLERELVEDLVSTGSGPLVVDGSLRDRPYHLALHAVVKDVSSTRYLPDERDLYGLPCGWRSPVFKLPRAINAGSAADRYSCYVRLHDARHQGWNFGLVRLEAYHPDQLTPLGRLAMVERQSARSGDGRWDRHLASVAATEKVLRSRRPLVFDL